MSGNKPALRSAFCPRYAIAPVLMSPDDLDPYCTLLVPELTNKKPEGTVLTYISGPQVRAAIALNKQNPAEALEVLSAALPYDMADLTIAYLRGQAYLAAHQGPEAVAEFQKIVDNKGTVGVDVIGAPAVLGLGRANAMAWQTGRGENPPTRTSLGLEGCRPQRAHLKQARAEYAKIQLRLLRRCSVR